MKYEERIKAEYNEDGTPTKETKLRADIDMHERTIDDLYNQINHLKSYQQKLIDWVKETQRIGNDGEYGEFITNAVSEAWSIVDRREY